MTTAPLSPRVPPGFRTVLLGGSCGVLTGAIGGAFAPSLTCIAPPEWNKALVDATSGAVIWGTAAALASLPIARVLARYQVGSWVNYGVFGTLFWATLAATIDQAQSGVGWAAGLFLGHLVALSGLWLVLPRILSLLSRGWLILALGALLFSLGHVLSHSSEQSPRSLSHPEGPTVELWSSPLPGPLGILARHHAFLAYEPKKRRWHRWEVWQFRNQGGTSWGHVHRDLLRPEDGVGGGPPRHEHTWHGPQAEALLVTLERSPEYPERDVYHAWPGPNSSTYIAWVLRNSGIPWELDSRALGQHYLGRVGISRSTTGTGFQAETPLLGLRVGLKEGIEIHFAQFTLGVDPWYPALKTPLGRFGFAE